MRAFAAIPGLLQIAALSSGCGVSAYAPPERIATTSCLQLVSAHHRRDWYRDGALVHGDVWNAMRDDPDAARRMLRSHREESALAWLALPTLALQLAGGLLVDHGVHDPSAPMLGAGSTLISVAASGYVTMFTLAFLSSREQRRAIDAYNAHARAHGCD